MVEATLNTETSFQKKIKMFSQEYLECCSYISIKLPNVYISNRSFCSRLAATSRMLDDFLNLHQAMNNTQWQLYAKMCSMNKYFSTGAYWQKHVVLSPVVNKVSEEEYFSKKAKEALSFLNSTMIQISIKVMHEANKLGISISKNTLKNENFPSIDNNDILDCNSVSKLSTSSEMKNQNIIKMADDFLVLVSDFSKMKIIQNNSISLLNLVPSQVNISKIRHFEMLIGNLRYFFDTCINSTYSSTISSELEKFKEYLDIIFYLLMVSKSLLDFYEKHLNILNEHCSRQKDIITELSEIVNPEQLLYWAIKFGLKNVYILLKSGEKLAIKILNQNIKISSIKVRVPIKFGFHTRPSLLVAKIVQHYKCKVYLEVGNDKFDASSVLNIQWAGGKIQREKICEVVFSGDTRALSDIKLLASINYGEDIMGKGIKMPPELRYLN